MAIWAYQCIRCGDPATRWWLPCDQVARLPDDAKIVHVKVKGRWLCASLDRSKRVSVEAGLLRTFARTDAASCDDCKDR